MATQILEAFPVMYTMSIRCFRTLVETKEQEWYEQRFQVRDGIQDQIEETDFNRVRDKKPVTEN